MEYDQLKSPQGCKTSKCCFQPERLVNHRGSRTSDFRAEALSRSHYSQGKFRLRRTALTANILWERKKRPLFWAVKAATHIQCHRPDNPHVQLLYI